MAESGRRIFRWLILPAIGVAAIALPAGALHDQGYGCYQCHTLEGGAVRPGSNSIRLDQPILGTIPTRPTATSLPLPGSGGYPISCDYCHRAAGDVPTTAFADKPKKHPVDLVQTGDNTANSHEITCNDCHNGDRDGDGYPDLTSATLTAKTDTDGYPDHDNAVVGYTHDLASNPPHLTRPYWGASVPGADRAGDTAFWTNVRTGTQDMMCWLCHDGVSSSPLTQVTANANVKAEYTASGSAAGHRIRSAVSGALGAGAALPCYDCHASHGSLNNALVLDSAPIEGTSTLAVTAYNQASRPYNDLVVCAECHDTGLPATTSGTRVEGMNPVDPFNSATTGSLHASSGVADAMASSTRNCLTANGGCHTSPHNPAVPCVTCHAPGGIGPTVVWPSGNASGKATSYGSHLGALRSDNLSIVTDWTVQCDKCHTGHAGPVRVPMPPASWSDPSGRLSGTNMAQRLGLDTYSVDNGIRLGGTATSGTTEADVCWNCHADPANNASEWGFNTKTTPAGYPVVLNTSPATFPTQHDGTADRVNNGWTWNSSYAAKVTDWTAGYWMNEYDNTLRNRVTSVHTASFDAAGQSSSVGNNVDGSGVVNKTTPVLENKSYVRCSYCHDVHELNRAQSDNTTGKPFLRGAWVGAPYPPDLPALSTYAYDWNEGPRTVFVGDTRSRTKGGFFIDQNSGNPTSNTAMDTLAETAGLCTLCHGTDVNGMDFYTGSKLWRTDTVNGHGNSTLGGTRTNARNLFDGNRGTGWGMTMQLQLGTYAPDYAPLYSYYDGGSVCLCPPAPSGWYAYPGDQANWYNTGGIGGGSGAGTQAHKFTCSKCHSPHAARLPALLTTNCLDVTRPNIWGRALVWAATNCHRKESMASGWHRLAPQQ